VLCGEEWRKGRVERWERNFATGCHEHPIPNDILALLSWFTAKMKNMETENTRKPNSQSWDWLI
jgi:hypothetical protein